MEKEKVANLNFYQNRIEELKTQCRIFESAKIKSVTLRTFNNDTCEFSEQVIEVVPRGKVKATIINHYQEEIKNCKEQIDKL